MKQSGFVRCVFSAGVELMLEWLIHIRHRIQRAEHIEICGLFLLMTLNFVVGFFFGMFMSLVVFASRYADVPVIKTVMDGSEYQVGITPECDDYVTRIVPCLLA